MADAEYISTLDVDQVCEMLKKKYQLPDTCIQIFHEEDVDGEALLLFQRSQFKEIFKMPLGKVMKLWRDLHNPSTSATNTAQLLEADINAHSKEVEKKEEVDPNTSRNSTMVDVGSRSATSFLHPDDHAQPFNDALERDSFGRTPLEKRNKSDTGSAQKPEPEPGSARKAEPSTSTFQADGPLSVDSVDNKFVLSSAPHDKPSTGDTVEIGDPTQRRGNMSNGAIPKTASISSTQRCANILSKHLKSVKFSVTDRPSPHATLCTLKHYHIQTPQNRLQELFHFLVLSRTEPKVPADLWNSICGEEKYWLSKLTDETVKEFDVDNVGIYSAKDKGYVHLREGKFVRGQISKIVEKPSLECVYVLIVDQSIELDEATVCVSVEKKQDRCMQLTVGNGQIDAYFDPVDLKCRLGIVTEKACINNALKTIEDPLTLSPHMEETISTSVSDSASISISETGKSLEKSTKKNEDVQVKDGEAPIGTSLQRPRKFDRQNLELFAYSSSSKMECIETGPSDLIQPVHEFKLLRVQNSDIERVLKYFVHETLRFSCGCLNERTNGTIHFGIADGDPKKAAEFGNFSKEIIGIPLPPDNQDRFIEKLNEFIGKSYQCYSTARQCIRPPVFVPVRNNTNPQQLFVIEVDVVPTATFCEDILFEVSLPKGTTVKPHTAFTRQGPNTVEVEGKERECLVKRQRSLDKERHRKDMEVLKVNSEPGDNGRELLHTRLQHLICFGKRKLDKSVYPILVLSSPANGTRGSADAAFVSNMNFIKTTNWKVVIDFDEEGAVRNSLFDEKQPNQYAIHCAEDFQDDETLKRLLDQPCWIWGNGSRWENKTHMEYLKWRNSERNKGLTRVIQHLALELPVKRVVVVFLLFSDSYKEMSVVFGEFCKQFEGPNQLVYVAPGENANHFQSELSQQYLDESETLERGVVGMPWSDVNRSMQQFCDIVWDTGILLPSPCGASIKTKRELFLQEIIYPIGLTDFDEIRKLPIQEKQDLALKKEQKFYRGASVTWENFWFTDNGFNHVCRRAEMKDMLQKITALLRKSPVDGRVFTFNLLHELGSGASTLSRHVIWDLSHTKPYKCRCCVVQQINDKTADQLLFFRRYKCENNEDILPVLALVDNIDGNLFDNFLFEMINKAQDIQKSKRPVIVFLQTKECTILPSSDEVGKESTTVLKQHLEKEDIEWFENKYATMSKEIINFQKYATENLISFMMMKQNFDAAYGISVAKRSFQNATEPEKDLLKYLSLLCYFDPQPVFTAAFDSIMVSPEFWMKKYFRDWLPDLTLSTLVLLREHDLSGHYGTGTAIAIVHPNIAKYILDIVGSAVGDIAIDFLALPLFESKNPPKTVEHLRNLLQVMLKNRRKSDYGDGQHTKFSPLIERIVSEPDLSPSLKGLLKAEAVLLRGLKLFADPMIAQQLARLFYLHADLRDDRHRETKGTDLSECFQEALKYADRAIEMQQNSSFLLDTKARIFRMKYHMLFDEIEKNNRSISIDEVIPAIEISSDSIKWFQKCQDANKQDRNQQNNYGYLGELATMQSLLRLFRCIPQFRSQQGLAQLCRYLTDESFVPEELLVKWEPFHDFIRQFECRFQTSLSYLREDSSVFKETGQTIYKTLDVYCVTYHEYFSDTSDGRDLSNDQKFQLHWRKINNYLSGDLFFNVFNIENILRRMEMNDDTRCCLETIKTQMEWNLQHCRKTAEGRQAAWKTVLGMITVSMALHSPYGPNKRLARRPEDASEYNAVYQLVKECCTMESQSDNSCLYPYLFRVMFLWPREDNEIPFHNLEEYEQALKLLREKENSKKRNQSEPDLKQNLYPKFTYRQRTRGCTTLFYLGKGSGMDVFVHINELPSSKTRKVGTGNKTRWVVQINWNDSQVYERLRRLKGHRENSSSITMNNPLHEEDFLQIHYVDIKHKYSSRGDVYFFLGFSWNGPNAFDVKTEEEERSSSHQPRQREIREKSRHPVRLASYTLYINELRKIDKKLEEIAKLEKLPRLDKTQKEKVAKKNMYIEKRAELTRKHTDLDIDFRD